MGWLWTSSNASAAQDQLDPSLRDFLKKEAPTGPRPALPSPPPKQESTEDSQAPPQAQPDYEPPPIPPQSQFQDGRYAHLWKNYTPQHILDDRGKSDQDRLRDLVDAYNDRKASIGRVAMENCATEYLEQFECFRNPKTWMSAGTLCNAESRKFNRCYDIQGKFLKALGYMTMEARTREEDERIQMHADKLYQQMMTQEEEIEKAKAEGRPAPQFESVFSKASIARAKDGVASGTLIPEQNKLIVTEEEDIWSQVKPESRTEYEKKLAALPPAEQEIERMAVLGELKVATSMSKKVEERFIEERISRMKRREAGQATIGDTIKRWWGWD